MQLDFMWEEMQGYKSMMTTLKSATSVLEASFTNGLAHGTGVLHKRLFAAPIRPLSQPITCAVLYKVPVVGTIVHGSSVGVISAAQLLLIGILQVGRSKSSKVSVNGSRIFFLIHVPMALNGLSSGTQKRDAAAGRIVTGISGDAEDVWRGANAGATTLG